MNSMLAGKERISQNPSQSPLDKLVENIRTQISELVLALEGPQEKERTPILSFESCVRLKEKTPSRQKRFGGLKDPRSIIISSGEHTLAAQNYHYTWNRISMVNAIMEKCGFSGCGKLFVEFDSTGRLLTLSKNQRTDQSKLYTLIQSGSNRTALRVNNPPLRADGEIKEYEMDKGTLILSLPI